MKYIILIIVCCLLSSCSTMQYAQEHTKFTYDVKKNKVSVKSSLNKYITLKY